MRDIIIQNSCALDNDSVFHIYLDFRVDYLLYMSLNFGGNDLASPTLQRPGWYNLKIINTD